MSKRASSHLLIVISFVLLITCICVFYEKENIEYIEKDYDTLIIDSNEEQEIKQTRTENRHILGDLFFNDYKLFFDDKNNKYYYSMLENNSSSYKPSVKYIDNNVEVKFVGNIDNKKMESNEAIPVIFYSADDFYESEMILTNLPLLNINTDVETLNTMDKKLEKFKKVLGSIESFDNQENAEIREHANDVSIKVRGNTSWKYEKKGYKLVIENKEIESQKQKCNLFGLREGNEYLLAALYDDPERIRNVFSSNLWYYSCAKNNMFNVDNGMYYKYIELFFNHEYWGLYAIGFPIDEQQEQLDLSSGKETIYKKVNWNYDIDVNNMRQCSIDDLLIGYEVDKKQQNEFSMNLLKQFYKKLQDDNTNIDELYTMSDIDNAIDTFLFFNLSQAYDSVRDGDGFINNVYLISKIFENNIKFIYTPWDLDYSWSDFRNNSDYFENLHYNYYMRINPVNNLLEKGDMEIKNRIIARYNCLRENEWSNEYVSNMLDKYQFQIYDSGAYLRDSRKWPNSTLQNNKNKLYDFKEYVLLRLQYFDGLIDDICGK